MIVLVILTIALLVGGIWGGSRAVRGTTGDQWGFTGIFLVWLLGVGIGANFFIYFIFSMSLEPNVPHHSKFPLVSISSIAGTSKPYYVGVNYDKNGNRIVNYIENHRGGPNLNNLKESQDDLFKIFYDKSGQPTIDTVTYSSEYWWVAPFPLLIDGKKQVPTYEFHVPSGTVLEDFKIK